jgi:hypothetical protein
MLSLTVVGRLPVRMAIARRGGIMAIAKSPVLWMVVLAAAVLMLLAISAVPASAAAPDVVGPGDTAFLCPDVGAGVLNHRPDAGELGSGGYTFLPGHNQAGAHANPNSNNTLGPADSPGPGNGNSDWSPIWPPPTN